jgi:hypothetical protein
MPSVPYWLLFLLLGLPLVATVAWTAFVLWDRRRHGTPWNLCTWATRVPLVMVAWPLFLVVLPFLFRTDRRPPARHE